MRVIKLSLISIIVLFVIATLMGLLLPSKVLVSRATDIQATNAIVKAMVLDLNRWPLWLPVNDSNVRFKASQNELMMDKTSISVLQKSDSSITSLWNKGSGNMVSTFTIINHPNGPQTVHWQMIEQVGWLPWQRMGSMVNEKIMGPVMEKGLSNMKEICEAAP